MRALHSGVTTARSAAVPGYRDVALRELFRAGGIKGPKIIPSGTFVEPQLRDNLLSDTRFASLHDDVTTDEDLRLIVNVNIERGSHLISQHPFGLRHNIRIAIQGFIVNVNSLATEYCRQNDRLTDIVRWYLKQITVKHQKICELTFFNRSNASV